MKEMHPNAERLAEAIATRRAEQHWSYSRVRSQGGPTKPTQMAYEQGDIPKTVTAEMLEKVDAGMGWEAGTALDILGGGVAPDPRSTPPQPDEPTDATVAADPGGEAWEVDPTKMRQMLGAFQRLRHQLQDLSIPADVKDAVNEVTAAQNEILLDQMGPHFGPKVSAPSKSGAGQHHPAYGTR